MHLTTNKTNNRTNSLSILPFLKKNKICDIMYDKSKRLNSLYFPINLLQTLHCSQFFKVINLLHDCLEAYIVRLTLKYLSLFWKSQTSRAKFWALVWSLFSFVLVIVPCGWELNPFWQLFLTWISSPALQHCQPIIYGNWKGVCSSGGKGF